MPVLVYLVVKNDKMRKKEKKTKTDAEETKKES